MIIIKYGGSILNPDGKYSEESVQKLIALLEAHPSDSFCLIIGGGKICRQVNDAATPLLKLILPEDQFPLALDELGIAVTKINARYLQSRLLERFPEEVAPELIMDPHNPPSHDYRISLATGFLPGHSTDYDTLILAKSLHAKKAIKISDFPQVLDVHPWEFSKAKLSTYRPFSKMSWREMVHLVGTEWQAGSNYPLDPSAAAVGLSLAPSGFTLLIGQYAELEKMVAGRSFVGTTVQG
jgi:uridylate kinase